MLLVGDRVGLVGLGSATITEYNISVFFYRWTGEMAFPLS